MIVYEIIRAAGSVKQAKEIVPAQKSFCTVRYCFMLRPNVGRELAHGLSQGFISHIFLFINT